MEKQKLTGCRILSILLCLTLTVGMFAMDGYAYATGLSTPEKQSAYTDEPIPMPAQGKVGVTLQVGTASARNMLMESPGLNSVLDFSLATVAGAPVGTRVASITFQDKDLTFSESPSPDDPLKITLNDVPDAVYARHVGDGGFPAVNNVVAYLVNADDGTNTFDMIVCGPDGVTAPLDCSALFAGLEEKADGTFIPKKGWQSGLEHIDLTHFDTSQTENLMAAFYFCENLTDITGIDTLNLKHVKNVRGMFRNCAALTDMDLSSWRTPALTDAAYLFSDCTALKSVNLTWRDTTNLDKVTTLRNMFYKNSNLETITGVEEWSLPEVTELTSFFYGCTKLTSLNLTAWKPEKVTCISHMFSGCRALKNLTLKDWSLPELQLMSSTFVDTGLEEIDLSTWSNLDKLTYFYATFQQSRQLKSVKLPGVGNAGYANIDFYVTFGQCNALKELDLSNWVFDSDKHLNYDSIQDVAFWGNRGDGPTGTKITADNIVIKDNAKIQTAKFPWVESIRVDPVVISANNWNLNDTKQNLSGFLTTIRGTNTITDFSGWTGLAGVTHMDNMFKGGTVLETVDLSGADLSGLVSAANMFDGVTTLTQIDLTGLHGITNKSVLAGIFNGVNPDVTLLTDDGEIGRWLKDEFSSPTTASVSSAPPENTSTFSAPELPEISRLHVDPAQEYLPPVEEEMAVAIPRKQSAVFSACAAEKTGSSITTYPEKTPVGTEVSLLATIQFEGINDAQSGEITLNVPLPENMAVADAPDIKWSAFKYTSSGTGSPGGTVLVKPEIKIENGVPTLYAVFDGMYTGTEVEISFTAKLNDTPLVDDYRLWDVTAHVQDADTQAASTLRFWWSVNNTPPTVRTVTYQLTNVNAQPQPIIALDGKPFYTTLDPDSGMEIKTVNVAMNGVSVTDTAYNPSSSKIEIASVNGDIHIEATATTTGGGGGGGGSNPSPKYPIVLKVTGNGTATADKTEAASGNSITIITKGTVRNISAVSENNHKPILLDDKGNGKYTFKMPTSEVTVFIDFKKGFGIADPDETGVSALLDTVTHNAYMIGVETNIFEPDRSITRAEVAQVFYRLLLNPSAKQPKDFPDVALGTWYYDAVAELAARGIILGATDGNFYPERPITRAELTAIASRFASESIAGDLRFSDVDPNAWFYSAALTAVNYGWIDGYPDGTFKPDQFITRAETSKVVNCMLARSADRNAVDLGAGVRFLDIPKNHWAFYEITEAATTHDFIKISQAVEEWVTKKD